MQNAAQQRVLAGRFRLESLLGEGGMGSVYVATDLSIGRRVAIKMLRADVGEMPDSVERLREEAFSLASLQHPNIVQLFDFQTGGPDGTFLVMELIEGETLAARLMRQPTLPFEVALDYAQQILSALAAAHSRGIIHRDIKPSNIIVMSVPARRDLVKILDFGIAKLTEETIRRKPTTAGMLLGTPTYMSPEQAAGRPVDQRADLYSVGLVLYRMLTGMNPFEGFDLATTLHRVQSVDPPPLSRMRVETPDHLAHAIARAVAKDPNARFSTAIEFAQSLGPGSMIVQRMSAPPAGYPPGAPQLGPSEPPPRTVTYPPGAGPNAAAGAMVLAPPNALRPPNVPSGTLASAQDASLPPESNKSFFWIGLGMGFVVMLLIGLTAAVAWLISRQNQPVANESVPEAGVPILAPTSSSTTSATTSASAKAPSVPPTTSASAKPASAFGLGGNCRCLPDEGNSVHGNNQRLAPRAGVVQECVCQIGVNEELCQKPFVDGSCPNRRVSGTLGGKCSGIKFEGNTPTTGTLRDCQFLPEQVDQYAKTPGKTCKGFMVDGKLVDGHIFCPR